MCSTHQLSPHKSASNIHKYFPFEHSKSFVTGLNVYAHEFLLCFPCSPIPGSLFLLHDLIKMCFNTAGVAGKSCGLSPCSSCVHFACLTLFINASVSIWITNALQEHIVALLCHSFPCPVSLKHVTMRAKFTWFVSQILQHYLFYLANDSQF